MRLRWMYASYGCDFWGVNVFQVCVRVIMVVILWIAGRKEADVRVSSWYMLVNYIYIFFFFILKI
jgi:hypothetical protein